MRQPQSITSIALSPEVERKSRMIRYTLAMTIRVVCIILAMVVQGWLMWVFFAAAILLPYFAVVIANGIGGSRVSKAPRQAVAPTLQISAEEFKSAKSTDE